MTCNCCAKKFGLFEKELGCPECGFSYCKKCLKHEVEDPNIKDATRKICPKCHIKQTKMEPPLDSMDEYAQKFRRCVETMCESDGKVKFDLKDQKNRFGSMREAYDHETEKLQERLQALESDYKKTQPKLKTEEELEEWLNQIQDKPSSSKAPSDVYRPPDTRTETESADQLMQQFLEEETLDQQRPKPEMELEARLARLRSEPKTSKQPPGEIAEKMDLGKSVEEESPTSSKRPSKGIWGLDLPKSEDSDEEEGAAEAIVKKALLDAEMGKLYLEEEEELDLEPKENPWCVVCNEDARLRCLDCDGDLYCDDCFAECCKPEEHNSEPYVIKSQEE